MAAGYRSNAAKWLGGASATPPPAGVAGYRSICGRWFGGASSYAGAARPGYRSMLAYWLGGAASFPYVPVVPIPEEPHGGGRGYQYEEAIRPHDEDFLTLIPIMLAVIEEDY